MTISPDLNGRVAENSLAATDATIAAKKKLAPSQVAIAFCNQRRFLTSSIIGATSIEHFSEQPAMPDRFPGPVSDRRSHLFR